MDLVELVYQETAKFPKEERYGLISQMRRSAVSITCNIAEGSGRKGDKELIQFIAIALGSIAELETQYMIAVRLKFIEENNRLRDLIIKVRQLLLGYRNYLKEKT
jgi:four helix bundle protein